MIQSLTGVQPRATWRKKNRPHQCSIPYNLLQKKVFFWGSHAASPNICHLQRDTKPYIFNCAAQNADRGM